MMMIFIYFMRNLLSNITYAICFLFDSNISKSSEIGTYFFTNTRIKWFISKKERIRLQFEMQTHTISQRGRDRIRQKPIRKQEKISLSPYLLCLYIETLIFVQFYCRLTISYPLLFDDPCFIFSSFKNKGFHSFIL